MEPSCLQWPDVAAVLDRRGLPSSSYSDLYQEAYLLHPAPLALPRSLGLDAEDPWGAAGGPPLAGGPAGKVTGYVVEGDLEIDGNLVNLDDGSPALVVLGDLRAANILLAGDLKLVVLGDVVAETFTGDMTGKLVVIHGDLRTRLAIMWNEFCPDLVGGCLYGRALVPPYLNLARANIGRIEDLAPEAGLTDLLVPEVLSTEGGDGDQRPGPTGVSQARLESRILAGLPVVTAGRTVSPLEY